jgi:hypothetical protein
MQDTERTGSAGADERNVSAHGNLLDGWWFVFFADTAPLHAVWQPPKYQGILLRAIHGYWRVHWLASVP